MTTDGHKAHLEAVEDAFGADIDYAKLIKIYGPDPKQEGETRYSPGKCNGADRTRVQGNLDPKYVSTSYVERQNLNMRMSMRRFTRLTNAFSKKVDNLQHALALHFMNYNFVRIHQTLRVTPAMEAGVTDTLWTLEDVAALCGLRLTHYRISLCHESRGISGQGIWGLSSLLGGCGKGRESLGWDLNAHLDRGA